MLCSFEDTATVENILFGGPWWVRGQVVGMDKWSTAFNPNSLKGISAPVWIRLPNLPLQCWDEVNICIIASMVGKPYLLDGNMFQWSIREYARVCVRIPLDLKLPKGIWVEGTTRKFYQAVEYEGFSKICDGCGRIGNVVNNCSEVNKDNVTMTANATELYKAGNQKAEAKSIVNVETVKDDSWIQVRHGNRRIKRMVDKRNFFNRISIPMKKIYVPKPGTDNSKKNVESKGGSSRDDQPFAKSIEMSERISEGKLGSNLLNKIPDKQQAEVTLVEPPLKIINKFDILATMEGSILNEAMESLEFGCIEEGEIVENIPHNISNVEAVFDEKSKLVHAKDKDVHNSEKDVNGNLSSAKKVKLFKELKSLGSGNILESDRKKLKARRMGDLLPSLSNEFDDFLEL
ncbi:hypothetical protein KFK09_022795 [Dendrobium nobile]|uniref:DUF4283 domain-containing protein n=1 Tax=Dendrobium nobile TaxID=94219 RepID=A0A8T3AKB8_DENNO|nr:hypothetical protein KFK09_022795 [Dendrobium nobile]